MDKETLKECVKYNITPLLYSNENIVSSIKQCQQLKLHYWLKLDSGMHRLGLNNNECISSLSTLDFQFCQAVFTHFKSAEKNPQQQASASATEQLQIFSSLLAQLPKQRPTLDYSHSNSAAVLAPGGSQQYRQWREQSLKLDQLKNEWIRPGIMLYGADPLDQPNELSQKLEAVMTFAAPIIDIRSIGRGESVGYNGTWQAENESIIATVGVGYADGYPRHAKNGTPVIINGQTANLVGRVSMDMICIDISELMRHHAIKVGDTVELWGKQLSANVVAKHADTIAYDLFTGITERVQRLPL